MVKVGVIAIDLVATTGKLLAPLRKAEIGIAGFAKRVRGLSGGGALGALGGALGMYKVVNGVRDAFSRLGAVSNESKRLGIPADKLMELQYAAGQADVELSTLTQSLKFFLKSGHEIGDIERVADEIANTTDASERMQKTLKYFGRSGAGMINLFENGSRGLRKFQAEARKVGVVFSQKQVDAVEAAGDAWKKFKEAVFGVYARLAVMLAPEIETFSESLTNVAVAAQKALEGLGPMIDDLGRSLTGINDDMSEQLGYMEALVGWHDRLQFKIMQYPARAVEGVGNYIGSQTLKDFAKAWRGSYWGAEIAARRSKQDGLPPMDPWGSQKPSAKFQPGTPPPALQRGSQEAFRAILESSRLKDNVEKQQLDEMEDINDKLGRIERKTLALAPAGLV